MIAQYDLREAYKKEIRYWEAELRNDSRSDYIRGILRGLTISMRIFKDVSSSSKVPTAFDYEIDKPRRAYQFFRAIKTASNYLSNGETGRAKTRLRVVVNKVEGVKT
jgi:hypothetical protein